MPNHGDIFASHPLLPDQKEPRWLISSQKIFSSTVEGHQDAAPCTEWRYAARHAIQDSFLDTFKKLGVVYSDPVEFGIVSGAHSAILQERFYKKQPFSEITFCGLDPGKKKSTVVRRTQFSNCFLGEIRSSGRKEYYAFYFSKISDTVTVFDPKTGHPKGNAVFAYDLVKGEAP
ncbi:MAG: hypothetical protein LBJ70_05725 [Holosporales bacterium]|jgi:hypothetical protein|nr:hypothetical protein [Holosporales bacterium]